jgi:protein-S-isoprenylcysteine O-methyltransferase Ste14
MRLLLAARSAAFVILMPGTVVGYIPYRILKRASGAALARWDFSSVCAVALFALGLGVLLRCVWDFAAAGRGTLAPIDPPRRLVVRGLYRFTRNPMYNGVLAALGGEAWFFRSTPLLEYAIAVFAVFHLFVVAYEEPALKQQFGEAYVRYRGSVPRWGFTTHGYRETPLPLPAGRGEAG